MSVNTSYKLSKENDFESKPNTKICLVSFRHGVNWSNAIWNGVLLLV